MGCSLIWDLREASLKLALCMFCAGGNCNTILVANIYGEAAHIEETVSMALNMLT